VKELKDVLATYHEKLEEGNKFLHDLTPKQKMKRDIEQQRNSRQFKKQINSRAKKR
jgi:hypothetical protein